MVRVNSVIQPGQICVFMENPVFFFSERINMCIPGFADEKYCTLKEMEASELVILLKISTLHQLDMQESSLLRRVDPGGGLPRFSPWLLCWLCGPT